MGENLRNNPEDILRLAFQDVNIWERFIAGYRSMSDPQVESKMTVLRHVALFERFGFEHPVEDEARFICQLVQETDIQITWPRFQSIVQELKQQRILQGKTTLFIVPKAAAHLALATVLGTPRARLFIRQPTASDPTGIAAVVCRNAQIRTYFSRSRE